MHSERASVISNLHTHTHTHTHTQAAAAHEAHEFREALIWSFDLMLQAYGRYRMLCTADQASEHAGMHRELVRLYITTQTLLLTPFCPHYAEHVWGLLGHAESVMHARWPCLAPPDAVLSRASTYLDKALSEVRASHDKTVKRQKAAQGRACERRRGLVVFVARHYLPWQVCACVGERV